MSLILTACNDKIEKMDEKQERINKILNANDSDSIDAIQVWCYVYSDDSQYKEIIHNITTKIRAYCKSNQIPIKIVKYEEKKISYDDYVLKRNTAMATSNVIVIDDARKLAEIFNQCYDYSKIKGYDSLFDMYKDRYCIPLGVGYVTKYVYGDFF